MFYNSNLISALRNSPQLDTAHWDSLCSLTLTLKQAVCSRSFWFSLDEYTAKKTFRLFMNRLNRACFGRRASTKYKKRLKVISVLEKDFDGRFHIHAAIEPPKHLNQNRFRYLVEKYWEKTAWGYERIQLDFDSDEGWVDYMLKPRQKAGMEAWSDCIDWDSLHNPIVAA